MNTVRLSPAANVVTAITQLDTGVEGAIETIPRGHKLATQPIKKDDPVLKYAQVIGYAGCDIAMGAHVHSHNLEFHARHHGRLSQCRWRYRICAWHGLWHGGRW